MKNSIIAIMFIFCFILMGFSPIENPPSIQSQAKSMVLIEQNTKRVLMEKDKDLRLPMASTTKIMTALCVLKHCDDFETEFEIDSRAVGIEGTSIYLRKGEKLSVKDLLYGLILPSANDASCALAYRISGSIHCFAELMNQEAKKLCLENTHFENPHGLDQERHFTSAYDLAVITAEAMQYPLFQEIISAKNFSIKGAGGEQGDVRHLRNLNKLLHSFDGCYGVKTGFTDKAGRCFVASSKRGDLSLICVVLNCNNMFEECANIMQWGFDNYDYVILLDSYSFYRKICVEKSNQSHVKLWTKRGFEFPLSKEETMKINYEFEVDEPLFAPLKKEQVVGKLIIKLDDKVLFVEDVYTMEEVRSNDIIENIKLISQNF